MRPSGVVSRMLQSTRAFVFGRSVLSVGGDKSEVLHAPHLASVRFAIAGQSPPATFSECGVRNLHSVAADVRRI